MLKQSTFTSQPMLKKRWPSAYARRRCIGKHSATVAAHCQPAGSNRTGRRRTRAGSRSTCRTRGCDWRPTQVCRPPVKHMLAACSVRTSYRVLHRQAAHGSPRQAGAGHRGVAVAQRRVPRLRVSKKSLLHGHAPLVIHGKHVRQLSRPKTGWSSVQHSRSRRRRGCRCFRGRCPAAAHIKNGQHETECTGHAVFCQNGRFGQRPQVKTSSPSA